MAIHHITASMRGAVAIRPMVASNQRTAKEIILDTRRIIEYVKAIDYLRAFGLFLVGGGSIFVAVLYIAIFVIDLQTAISFSLAAGLLAGGFLFVVELQRARH